MRAQDRMAPEHCKAATNKRTVCDHCRRRRIRCDGEFPCNQCNNASLTCKREHVPKRRGPKRGSGRVINELRAQEEEPKIKLQTSCSSQDELSSNPSSIDRWMSESNSASTSPTTAHNPRWHPILSDSSHYSDEPASIFTSDHYRPSSPSYLHLIPTCLDLFMEHIYPIMPLVHMPTLRESITRPLEMFEKNLLYSLCALTSTHMSGKNIIAPGPPSWEAAGRFFLDECLSVRQSYDFVEDKSLSAVISSYFVSTAFFELNQSRKSWYYLREALTLGQDLRFHDEASYEGLSPAEALCRRRTFWILYVTERSFAILRHKPLTLSKTPAYPTTIHPYELPTIHTGFMHLVNSYHLLDNSFVESWNEASHPTTSQSTYKTLQAQLSLPFAQPSTPLTDIQKADILITQQWLRLIIWQSSMRQGLLSSTAEDESMTFSYPLKIAESLLGVIKGLPERSIEVHGMGIMEKIFEIGNTMLDVMHACGSSLPALEEQYGVGTDPFGLFIKTLSQTPNSQKQYATLLLQKAAEKPEILRFSSGLGDMTLTDGSGDVSAPTIAQDNAVANEGNDGAAVNAPGPTPFLTPTSGKIHLASPVPTRQWRGSIVGEIDDNGEYTNSENEVTSGRSERNDSTSTMIPSRKHGIVDDGSDETDDESGQMTWSEDAVWIAESSHGEESSLHDGLPSLIDGSYGTLSSGPTLRTESSLDTDIMLDADDLTMVIDSDVDGDVDWDFAVKLEP